jgi:predicted lipoprotein with Yx(FWY)xxD motif
MYFTRNRLAVSLAGLGVLALAAGCGGGVSTGSSAPPAAAGQGTTTATVSVSSSSGSKMLVGPTGAVLYSNDQDTGGKPKCVSSACTAVWIPLTVPAGQQPVAASGVGGKIATVPLANGKNQVTLNNKPLYIFALDGQPGQASGNGVGDSFGGTSFTWHSAVPAGAAPAPAAPPAGGIPGY